MMSTVKNIAIIAKANNKFGFWYNAYDQNHLEHRNR
jgi:hypothetical protein